LRLRALGAAKRHSVLHLQQQQQQQAGSTTAWKQVVTMADLLQGSLWFG
jgi:hypothetical protein